MSKMKLRPRGRPKNAEHLARRREEILHKAAEVFAARGFPGTDLQVVADALKIGKGTVYRYFPSKHELFLASADLGMQMLLQSLSAEAQKEEDPIDQIAAAIRGYLGFFDRNPEYVESLIQERAEFRDRKNPTYFHYRQANQKEWSEFFRDLIRQGRIRKMRVDAILDGLHDLLYGAIFTNHFANGGEPLEEQSDRIVDLVFHGILSEGERKRMTRRRR